MLSRIFETKIIFGLKKKEEWLLKVPLSIFLKLGKDN